jgi:hypothetical protein
VFVGLRAHMYFSRNTQGVNRRHGLLLFHENLLVVLGVWGASFKTCEPRFADRTCMRSQTVRTRYNRPRCLPARPGVDRSDDPVEKARRGVARMINVLRAEPFMVPLERWRIGSPRYGRQTRRRSVLPRGLLRARRSYTIAPRAATGHKHSTRIPLTPTYQS